MAGQQIRKRAEAWRDRSACTGEPTELFFPEVERVHPAVAELCGRCPVREDCLDYAIAGHEAGIWAATTSNERKRIARERRTLRAA